MASFFLDLCVHVLFTGSRGTYSGVILHIESATLQRIPGYGNHLEEIQYKHTYQKNPQKPAYTAVVHTKSCL